MLGHRGDLGRRRRCRVAVDDDGVEDAVAAEPLDRAGPARGRLDREARRARGCRHGQDTKERWSPERLPEKGHGPFWKRCRRESEAPRPPARNVTAATRPRASIDDMGSPLPPSGGRLKARVGPDSRPAGLAPVPRLEHGSVMAMKLFAQVPRSDAAEAGPDGQSGIHLLDPRRWIPRDLVVRRDVYARWGLSHTAPPSRVAAKRREPAGDSLWADTQPGVTSSPRDGGGAARRANRARSDLFFNHSRVRLSTDFVQKSVDKPPPQRPDPRLRGRAADDLKSGSVAAARRRTSSVSHRKTIGLCRRRGGH